MHEIVQQTRQRSGWRVRPILAALGVTRSSYGDAKLKRLRALKREWDPTNVFRLNHNIEPSDA